jgi:hypothetical protein
MPRFGSSRGKMLALILTPVAAAIILTTRFAISRASSEQRQSSFAELAQRTEGESLKVDQTVGGALATANAAAAVLGGADTPTSAVGGITNLLTANSKNVMAVFSGLSANAFTTPGKGVPGTDEDGTFQPSITLDKQGVVVAGTADGVKSATAYVAKPVPGVQEPATYEGTMYVTYQASVTRNGMIIGLRRHRQHAGRRRQDDLFHQAARQRLRVRRLRQGRLRLQPGQEQRQAEPGEAGRPEEQPRARAGRRLDRRRQGRPDRDQGPVHGQGHRRVRSGPRRERLGARARGGDLPPLIGESAKRFSKQPKAATKSLARIANESTAGRAMSPRPTGDPHGPTDGVLLLRGEHPISRSGYPHLLVLAHAVEHRGDRADHAARGEQLLVGVGGEALFPVALPQGALGGDDLVASLGQLDDHLAAVGLRAAAGDHAV